MKKLLLAIIAALLLTSCSKAIPLTPDDTDNSESVSNYFNEETEVSGQGKHFQGKVVFAGRVTHLTGTSYAYTLLIAPLNNEKLAITTIDILSSSWLPYNSFRYELPVMDLIPVEEKGQLKAWRCDFCFTIENMESLPESVDIDEVMKEVTIKVNYNLIRHDIFNVRSESMVNADENPALLEKHQLLRNIMMNNYEPMGITEYTGSAYPASNYYAYDEKIQPEEEFAIEEIKKNYSSLDGPFYISSSLLLHEAEKPLTYNGNINAYIQEVVNKDDIYAVFCKDEVIGLIIQKGNTSQYEWYSEKAVLEKVEELAKEGGWYMAIKAYNGIIRYIRTLDDRIYLNGESVDSYDEKLYFPDLPQSEADLTEEDYRSGNKFSVRKELKMEEK